MLQDLLYAWRALRSKPGLSLVVIFSLAIGIGVNSAIFSVVDALLLRPLPYPHPERLANIWLHSPGLGIFRDWPSPGQFLDLKGQNHSFDEMDGPDEPLYPDRARSAGTGRLRRNHLGAVSHARRETAAGPFAAS
jgi:hypothetical protein